MRKRDRERALARMSRQFMEPVIEYGEWWEVETSHGTEVVPADLVGSRPSQKNFVQILGEIWMPYGALCAQEQTLSAYDVENIRGEGNGRLTRKAVERWLASNSGDFSRVVDFRASIGTREFPWKTEEHECDFHDAYYGVEE